MIKKILIILVFLGLTVGLSKVLAVENAATSNEPIPLVIDDSTSTVSTTVPEVNLQYGARSGLVKAVQQLLKNLGYLPADLEPTEYFGQMTRDAIKQFQKDYGLPATGFWGPMTRLVAKGKILERAAVDNNVNIACIKPLVEKRENDLLAAYNALTDKLKLARETRKNDLLAAWSYQNGEERLKLIKDAWKKYQQAVKTARNEWYFGARKNIWKQFINDAKKCNASIVETEKLEIIEGVPVE